MKKIMLFSVIVFLTGCSTFKEVHYFKDKAGPIPNYYKLTIKGHNYFGSSRYLSGYFDEEAVNDYFSELSQPKDAKFKPSEAEKKGTEMQPLGKKLEDRRLVMILSSNSDAIATQIGAFVENKKNMDALAKVLNRDKAEELNVLNNSIKIQETKGEILTTLGDQLIETMDETAISAADAEKRLLQYVNALAAELGNKSSFTTLDEAEEWLNINRSNF